MKDFIGAFKLWSSQSPEIKESISPTFRPRKFSDLNQEERRTLWAYLKPYFYKSPSEYLPYEDDIKFQDLVSVSIYRLNSTNKYHSFGKRMLAITSRGDVMINAETSSASKADFEDIVLQEQDNVILELLTIFLRFCLSNISHHVDVHTAQKQKESNKSFEERKDMLVEKFFSEEIVEINDIFDQFGMDYVVTLTGIVAKQDEKIISQIYSPVLSVLSNAKWQEVSKLLSDSLDAYHRATPSGYSESITNSVSALEAFLQISLDGRTGTRSLGALASAARDRGVIPDDNFSKTVIEQLTGFLAKERKETGLPHPKKEYATNKNARLVLNIVMIFIQHSLQ